MARPSPGRAGPRRRLASLLPRLGGAALEDEIGGPAPATADDPDAALQPHRPRALFLSACETAAADAVLGSLAAALVWRVVPAVLGWGGSVLDHEASRFAAELYKRLSRHGRLDEAVAWARLDLLDAPGPRQALQGLAPGAPLRRPSGRRRSHLRLAQRQLRYRGQVAVKAFLDARQQVPVAGPEAFVGRRRDLQRILGAFGNAERVTMARLPPEAGGRLQAW